jgi:hypothetical protein
MISRRAVLAGLPLVLAGCTGQSVIAPPEDIARVAYHHDGPPALTLITVKNVGTENGAHTGLMIAASQRVIFDPAGSFGHPSIPENNDVLFGITPRVEAAYLSYHARLSFYAITQTVQVPPQVAEQALALARAYGPVAKANCARATVDILHQLPGFESLHFTLFPDNLEAQFARLPGVVRQEYREYDPDDNSALRGANAPPLTPAP